MSLAVLGASSVVGRETARVFLRAGHTMLLISRATSGIKNDYRGEKIDPSLIDCFDSDVSHVGSLESIAEKIINSFDDDPYVLIAVGTLGNVSVGNEKIGSLLEIIDVNFRNVAVVIGLVSKELQRRGAGCIIFLSSVAGDKGRQSNFFYGASKAGLNTFAQGLRTQLFDSGVHVLTVKLGYVDTPMFRKSLGPKSEHVPKFLVGDPAKVGESIFRAAIKRKNVVYIRPIWRLVMFIVRSIPEPIFKRLRL